MSKADKYRELLAAFKLAKEESEAKKEQASSLVRQMAEMIEADQETAGELARFKVGSPVFENARLGGGYFHVGNVEKIKFDYNYGNPTFVYGVRSLIGGRFEWRSPSGEWTSDQPPMYTGAEAMQNIEAHDQREFARLKAKYEAAA